MAANQISQDFSKAAFQAHLNEHRLMGARCRACGALYLPPRPICSACYSSEMDWEQLTGEGQLVAFTTIYIAPTAMIEAGYGRDNPYCSGVVKLNAGPSISAQIVSVPAADPSQIKIGQALTAEFVERGEGENRKTFLLFRATG